MALLRENLRKVTKQTAPKRVHVPDYNCNSIVDDGSLQARFEIAQRERFEAQPAAEIKVHNATLHVEELEIDALALHMEIVDVWGQLKDALRHPEVLDPTSLFEGHAPDELVRTGMLPYFVRKKSELFNLLLDMRGLRADMEALQL